MINQCKILNYTQQLRFLELPTLVFRRIRGDMTGMYKILTGKYDKPLVPKFPIA